jgi:outer membrane protein
LPVAQLKKLPAISVFLLGAAMVASAQVASDKVASDKVASDKVQPATPVVVAPPGPNTPAPIKVATIFGQNALASTLEGKQAAAALTAKFGPKRDDFNRKQAELQALRDQLKGTLSAEARKSLNQSVEAKNREVERLGQDTQAALEQEEGALMQRLNNNLMSIIQNYGSRNGYAVVIDVSLPNGPVLWASPSIDITNEIVRLYDQAHPVAAAPPTAAPQKK